MDIKSASSAKGSLVPGFRFHPTDEELVRYYLRRKIGGKPFRFDAISEIDIYKVEPWDLPDKSKLKSRDLEWYFFSVLDKKYGNGSKTNRATDRGYWKTTGKDRAVFHRTQIVGMKKTLVYHSGRAPRGERTNWVMHEYRLIDEEMEKAGIVQDAFVLCRIFLKSGSGPKNGEKYGAPFMEEEWEDDDLAIVPKDEYAEELPLSDDSCLDAYLDENDLEQILNAVDPSPDTSLPLSFAYGEENHYVEEHTNCINDPQNFIVDMDENNHVMEQPDGGTLFNLPVQYDMDGKAVKREFIGESSYSGETSNTKHPVDLDYLLNERFLDAMDNPTLGEGAFIESNDLKQPAEMDPSSFDMLDEYLQFFDATDDNLQNLDFDYSDMMGSDALALPSDPASLLPYENVNKGKEDIVEGKEHLDGNIKDFPSSSKQAQTKFGSDFQYPFMEKASQMLGNIHAPSAFASEFPKDAALRMNSTSSSAVRVIAGMIQIRDLNLSGPGMDLSFGKQGRVYITLSFGMPRGDDYSVDSDKANSVISWGWFCFMFMWMLFATMSCKIGTYICAK